MKLLRAWIPRRAHCFDSSMTRVRSRLNSAGMFAALLLTSCTTPESEWRLAESADSIPVYEEFLARYPDSTYADSAREAIVASVWEEANALGDSGDLADFLRTHPTFMYAEDAQARLLEVSNPSSDEVCDYNIARREWEGWMFKAFTERYPSSAYAAAAEQLLASFESVTFREGKYVTSESLRSSLGLIRFRGHRPKGGYDGQNGIKAGRETSATTVL